MGIVSSFRFLRNKTVLSLSWTWSCLGSTWCFHRRLVERNPGAAFPCQCVVRASPRVQEVLLRARHGRLSWAGHRRSVGRRMSRKYREKNFGFRTGQRMAEITKNILGKKHFWKSMRVCSDFWSSLWGKNSKFLDTPKNEMFLIAFFTHLCTPTMCRELLEDELDMSPVDPPWSIRRWLWSKLFSSWSAWSLNRSAKPQ